MRKNKLNPNICRYTMLHIILYIIEIQPISFSIKNLLFRSLISSIPCTTKKQLGTKQFIWNYKMCIAPDQAYQLGHWKTFFVIEYVNKRHEIITKTEFAKTLYFETTQTNLWFLGFGNVNSLARIKSRIPCKMTS